MTTTHTADGLRLELPVVTHYSREARGVCRLAADAPELVAPIEGPYPAGCRAPFFLNGFFPDFGVYLADVYADRAVPNEDAIAFFTSLRDECGVSFAFLHPDVLEKRTADVGRLRTRVDEVQVVHARVIDGSLATIMLPPGWDSDASPGRYPVVFNGFYDINQNLFELEGRRWLRAVAWSGTDGRTGAIGVLWNGGGAIGSRTAGAQAFRQFSSVVDYVSETVGGDRHRIFMSGGSRGGLTSIGMASNPYGYDYTVRFSGPTATPTMLGEHALLGSVTYPGMLHAVGWSTGFADAWRSGWRYPRDVGHAAMAGLTGAQAHAHVLTGESDLGRVTAEHSPISNRYVEGLRRAGTQVYLEVTAFDNICPYNHQLAYGLRLLREGFPVRMDVLARAGHNERTEEGLLGRQPVRFNHMIAALRPHVGAGSAPVVDRGIGHYAMDRATREFVPFGTADGLFPFSLEAPYVLAAGTRAPVVAVGEPGTDVSLRVESPTGREVCRLDGRIPGSHGLVTWLSLDKDTPAGSYAYSLQIRTPGGDWRAIDRANTITRDRAVLNVVAAEPDIHAAETVEWASAPALERGNTNWGLSEY